jgi:glutamine synthetase
VLEAAIRYDDVERAADKAGLFKTFTKVLAQRRGLMATFMAKWSNDFPGQSGHAHLSLIDEAGNSMFFDPSDPNGMSATMRHFIAGQVRLMPEVLAMVCPTINSYRRMVPGLWAPTAANWGIENRTTALRAIAAGPATRVEYRIGPADANPYLILAAALATGLHGIEHRLEPGPPIVGNAYEQLDRSLELPQTLAQATQRFVDSPHCHQMFGATFVDHFASTRWWEDRQARKHVSDWDLARYFEII